MSALRNVAQGFRKVWGMGDDDEYEEEEPQQPARRAQQQPSHPSEPASSEPEEDETPYERVETRTQSRTVYAPTASLRGQRRNDDEGEEAPRTNAAPQSAPTSGGGSRGPGGRGLRAVSMPLRAREKNIYTLKPKTMDEASLAADYLKTGCAVVVNLEEVERLTAIRIIDFMSGVCYGLEHQGHAMKLGEIIFLFTPGDFEISSDEVDYGENTDFIFKDVNPNGKQLDEHNAGERRSWER